MSGVRLPSQSKAFRPSKPVPRRPTAPTPASSGAATVTSQASASQTNVPAPAEQDASAVASHSGAESRGQPSDPSASSQTATATLAALPDVEEPTAEEAVPADGPVAPSTSSRSFAPPLPSPSLRQPSLSPFPVRESSTTSSLSRPRTALLQAAAASAAAGPSKSSPGRLPKRASRAPEGSVEPAVGGSGTGEATAEPGVVPTLANGLPPTVSSQPASLSTPRPGMSGLPPTLAPASTSSNTNGLPPSLAPAAPSPQPEAGPSRTVARAHQFAESLIEELRQTPDPYIGSPSPSEPGIRKKRAPPGQGKARLARLAREAKRAKEEQRRQERREQGLPSASPPAPKKRKLPRRIIRGNAESLDEEMEYETPEEEAARLARKRGPYGSRGRAGTEFDLRRRENRHRSGHGKKDLLDLVPQSHPELMDAVPDQMIGEMVDERVMTMRELATISAHEGRASARGILLQRHRREESRRKTKESARRQEDDWRRRQLQRRKLRAEKNAERARRRQEMGEGGEGEEAIRLAVSEDEEDSDETFELEPDRLTPPTTPESQTGDLHEEREDGEGEEGEEDEEREGEEQDGDDGDEEVEPAEEEEEGLFLNPDEEEPRGPRLRSRAAAPIVNAETAEAEADQEADPFSLEALRAAGLAVDGEAEDGDAGNDRGNDGEEEGDENYEIEEEDFGVDRFRDRQDERRRQVMQGEDARVVEEEEEETRFINQNTWGKGRQGTKWTDEDTEMFYAALREVGENYSLIKAWFPGRSVYEIKRKAVRENKAHPERVTAAVLNRRPMDKDYLTKSSGYNASRPFDKETTLFEQAKRDVEALRGMPVDLDADGLQKMDEDQGEEKSDDEGQDDKGDE